MKARLVLSCLLVLMMAGCSKCGGNKAKDEYTAKLDAMCMTAMKDIEGMQKQFAEAQAKDDMGAVASVMEQGRVKSLALKEAMKAVPQPPDNAADLAAFWAESDALDAMTVKSIEVRKHMAEVNARLHAAAPAPAPEGEGHEGEEAPAAPAAPSQEEVNAAEAEVMQANQGLAAQVAKLDAAARKYGFKVCGVMPAAPKQ